MTPVLCGLFKLLSSDSLSTEYVTIAIPDQICIASCILHSGIHGRTSISLKISNHFLLLNPVLDPVIHVLRIREYRDRLNSVCRCYNQANNNTGDQIKYVWPELM
jgi:hypothetical protein